MQLYDMEYGLDSQPDNDQYKYYYHQMLECAFQEKIVPMKLNLVENSPDLYEDEAEYQQIAAKMKKFEYQSTEISYWDDILEMLADCICADQDWQLVSLNPAWLNGGNGITRHLGISDSYLTNRLPKVTKKAALAAGKAIDRWKVEN